MGGRTPALYRVDRSCSGRHPKPFGLAVIRTGIEKPSVRLPPSAPQQGTFTASIYSSVSGVMLRFGWGLLFCTASPRAFAGMSEALAGVLSRSKP